MYRKSAVQCERLLSFAGYIVNKTRLSLEPDRKYAVVQGEVNVYMFVCVRACVCVCINAPVVYLRMHVHVC